MDFVYSQHRRPRCSIQDLSSELVFMIMDHLPPPTQFDLASTCKQLAVASRGILERHQNSRQKYQTASDLDPSTVPLLLRSAFGQGDPIPAWHVRSFEIWKDRTTWSDWQTFDLHTPLVPEPVSKPSQFRVSKENTRQYLYWFEEQLGEDLDYELVEKLLAQVENGHDGMLKALLFAKLERLVDFKSVTRSQEAGSCLTSLRILIAECIKKKASDHEKEIAAKKAAKKKSCDCKNCSVKNNNDIEKAKERGNDFFEQRTRSANVTAPWPAGFCNVRKVAVGVASGTWMDDNRDVYHLEPSTFLFSHLLRLPSLDTIYFNKLSAYMDSFDQEMDREEEECDYDVLPKGSSSVKHVFLNGCCGLLGDVEEELWDAPRELLTMSIRHDAFEEYDGATGTANLLARAQAHSLQSLMWYGYQGGYGSRNILGDHCSILDDEEFDHFKRLPVIKQVSYSVHDIELCMEHADFYMQLRHDPEEGRDDDDDHGNIYDEDDHEEFIVRRVATMFPRTIETLVLWDSPDDEDTITLIERGIVKMIQCGQYKNLKAIFLEATERATEVDCQRKEESWFQDAVTVGKETGVNIYTLSNQEGRQHSIDFAEAPDEYDLRSGIHAGIRPSKWGFNPYLGRRIPPGCKAERYNSL